MLWWAWSLCRKAISNAISSGLVWNTAGTVRNYSTNCSRWPTTQNWSLVMWSWSVHYLYLLRRMSKMFKIQTQYIYFKFFVLSDMIRYRYVKFETAKGLYLNSDFGLITEKRYFSTHHIKCQPYFHTRWSFAKLDESAIMLYIWTILLPGIDTYTDSRNQSGSAWKSRPKII